MISRLRFLRPLTLVAVFVAGGCATAPPVNHTGFKPGDVLAAMERVADWQLANPSRHRPTEWTQGAGYTGIMALSQISASSRFETAMLKMGETNEWKLGRRRYHADDHVVGQTYVELYQSHRDPRMIAPMRTDFDFILANPKDENLDFDRKKNPDHTDKWSWCDALFMGPPAWIRLWSVTGERAYLDFAVEKWWETSAYLYDKEEHLYFRDSTYFTKREANGKKVFWSRGNGWVMGGLVRVLQYLPADHPARPSFVQQFREMSARILAVQQDDGLWRSSLLDPASYPLRETSGSGFYTYALAWGVNEKLLDRTTYTPAVVKAWNALNACVAPDGKLTHVQPIGADPKKFAEDSTEIYGVGAFLLAGSEVYRLSGGTRPPPRPLAVAAPAARP
jgi:unsaturated rhamnogalacturonyl hydrolase